MGIKYQIIVEINPDGEVVLTSGKGFKGAKCYEEIVPVAKALGDAQEVKRLPEYYEVDEKSKQKHKYKKKVTTKTK